MTLQEFQVKSNELFKIWHEASENLIKADELYDEGKISFRELDEVKKLSNDAWDTYQSCLHDDYNNIDWDASIVGDNATIEPSDNAPYVNDEPVIPPGSISISPEQFDLYILVFTVFRIHNSNLDCEWTHGQPRMALQEKENEVAVWYEDGTYWLYSFDEHGLLHWR